MPISSTNQIDSTGGFRRYSSTVDMSASGSSIYYKCATVGAGTWTGYERLTANAFGGTFALTATNLTYTDVPPVVGLVYDSTGQMNILQPLERGLICDIPLSALSATTGQTLTNSGVTFAADSDLGTTVGVFSTPSYITVSTEDLPNINDYKFSISFWVKSNANVTTTTGLLSWGTASSGCIFSINYEADNKLNMSGHYPGYGMSSFASLSSQAAWNHIILTNNKSACNVYINNTLALTGKFTSTMTTISGFYLGSYWGAATYIANLTGKMASIRINKNHIYTAEERAILSEEYTVTT